MEQQTLKITNVLADPTRFSIYQYITKVYREVTVQEIADTFGIHANVARLHLSKLEDVKMLISETQKTGKGGRPSRVYKLSDEVVSLQFPYRDYQRLAELCLETLVEFGDQGLQVLRKIGLKYGSESAERFVVHTGARLVDLTTEDKLSYIEKIAYNQGLNPDLTYNEKEKKATFSIKNCTFKELIDDHANALCPMHHSLIQGIFEYFFGNVKVEEVISMKEHECSICQYRTVLS
ncbi:helix-turn-helix transcriptional regulator [Bacillus alkalicellulosilyticus]|uniref:helix-turn-helix transcriptional regulator n=1 Tax=Alkalihalobacterium alkalicellulosilyticum TaxID=1912214 RepID=UPI000996787E|nr:helix-turn-helix domain-containing protein [Bacillus alkalicellulosilyticus]